MEYIIIFAVLFTFVIAIKECNSGSYNSNNHNYFPSDDNYDNDCDCDDGWGDSECCDSWGDCDCDSGGDCD